MSKIFGGSKSKSVSQSTQSSTAVSNSGNQAYAPLSAAYMPAVNQGNAAVSQIGALLGLGGDTAAANTAFDNYRGSTDYQFTLDQGNKAINNNAAISGQVGSGKTLKAIQGFGQNTANKYLGDYISKLLGIGTYGTQAGGLIAGAGQQSNSNSSSIGQSTGQSSSSTNEGIAKTLGAAASMAAASDRRLKKDIVLVDRLDDGLGVYDWTYISGGPRYRGHMADEIEAIRPWALGPTIDGYQTVDYAKV